MKIHLPKSKKSKLVTALILVLIIILLSGVVYALTNNYNKETISETSNTVTEAKDVATETQAEQPVEEPVVITPTPPAPPKTDPKPPTSPPASQWPVQLTSTQAASITVIVNKKHKLPSAYVPALTSVSGGQLRIEAANAFNAMVNAASATGVQMSYGSGYRSYARQQQLYSNYVAQDGQVAADTYSARPGHSEHQTGLAVDITDGGNCYLRACFANTAAGQWVAANAQNYGFIIRYPNGKESITGYQYEPWHLRYLGVNEATVVYNSGKTLEEYYGIPGGGY